MSSRLLVISVLTAMAFVACTKTGGGSGAPSVPVVPAAPLTPLSTEDQATFDQTANNVADSTSGWQNKNNGAANANLKTTSMIKSAIAVAPATQPSGKAQLEKLVMNNCKITPPDTSKQPTNESTASEMSFSIDGENCPISMGWNSKMQTGENEMSMAFGIYYSPKSAEAKQALDIQSYKLDINVAAHSVSDAEGTIAYSGGGIIASRSQGNVKITVSGGGSVTAGNGTDTQIERFTYPTGLTVELKKVATYVNNYSEASAYFINEKSVSEKVFNQYMDKFGITNNPN